MTTTITHSELISIYEPPILHIIISIKQACSLRIQSTFLCLHPVSVSQNFFVDFKKHLNMLLDI